MALSYYLFLGTLGNYSTVRQTLYRSRRATMPPLPADLNGVQVPDCLKITLKGDNFLQTTFGDNNNRIMIFYTASSFRMLCEQDLVLADGTFHFAPFPFRQLYTLHAKAMGQIILPLVFCLLPNKSAETYSRLFTRLRHLAIDLNIIFNPPNIMIDYELAAKQSWLQVFPIARMKGCMFHYGQANWRNIQSKGLSVAYNTDDEFAQWARLFFALPMIPLQYLQHFFINHIANVAPIAVSKLYFYIKKPSNHEYPFLLST